MVFNGVSIASMCHCHGTQGRRMLNTIHKECICTDMQDKQYIFCLWFQ